MWEDVTRRSIAPRGPYRRPAVTSPDFGVTATATPAEARDHYIPSYALPLALAALPVLVAVPPAVWLAVGAAAALGVGATVAQARREGRFGGLLPRAVAAATD